MGTSFIIDTFYQLDSLDNYDIMINDLCLEQNWAPITYTYVHTTPWWICDALGYKKSRCGAYVTSTAYYYDASTAYNEERSSSNYLHSSRY
jgi:hypothetical protein